MSLEKEAIYGRKSLQSLWLYRTHDGKVSAQMKSALVTGVAGFIGSHVADELLLQGYKVYGLDNLSTGKMANVPKGVELLVGDLAEIKRIPRVDKVFHLAALARIPESIKDPIKSNQTNVDGTLHVLEYCKEHSAKIVFSSTCALYAQQEGKIAETSPLDPLNPYAIQKMQAEQYILWYWRQWQIPFTVFRYFNVFGERQLTDGAYAAVVGIFQDQKAKKQPLTIVGDGEQRRDFVYVKDVAKANVMLSDLAMGVYNIGSGKNYSVNELADAVDKGGKRKYLPARNGELRTTLCDNSLARTLLWKPTVDILEWTRGTVKKAE